jgi:hypothetical protein
MINLNSTQRVDFVTYKYLQANKFSLDNINEKLKKNNNERELVDDFNTIYKKITGREEDAGGDLNTRIESLNSQLVLDISAMDVILQANTTIFDYTKYDSRVMEFLKKEKCIPGQHGGRRTRRKKPRVKFSR